MTSPASSTEVEWVMSVPCEYGVEHSEHIFDEDWIFGGANGIDPRADIRWMPTTYQYFDDKLKLLHTTQTPLCDDQAIDEFTVVSTFGPDWNPVWIAVKRQGEEKFQMLPVKYDKATDEVKDMP